MGLESRYVAPDRSGILLARLRPSYNCTRIFGDNILGIYVVWDSFCSSNRFKAPKYRAIELLYEYGATKNKTMHTHAATREA